MKSTALCLTLVLGTGALLAEVRSPNGEGNNEQSPLWGSAGSQLQRFALPYYGDGMAAMGGSDRPGPRTVSNRISHQATLTQNARGLSDMVWCWGQFLDHDISLVLPSQDEFVPVMVGEGDPMAPMIPIMRSQFDPVTGTDIANPRQQMNSTTSFIDASMVYGQSAERAAALRTFQGGFLHMREGGLLPWNTAEIEMENPNQVPASELYMAGDVRANENPALISMQTLWLREHNRWAETLAMDHPTWTDEELYQHARRMVMGEIQNITFQEFLPALLGPHAPAVRAVEYDPALNPGMFNEVSGALYRIGHTMVSANIMKVYDDGSVAPDGSFHFKDAFFQPTLVNDAAMVGLVLKGVASKRMQEIDVFVVDDLRNFLFAQPGQGGIDLISINLQRGRDHGLPAFNQARVDLGLDAYTDFSEISANRSIARALEETYGEIGLVDLWIGAMAEDHLPGASVGETIATALAMQFRHLRDGDRFFFLHDAALTGEEKSAILNTTLADVIQRNTTLTNLQEDVFRAPPLDSWMDWDRDGAPDILEVIAGTDPTNPASVFRLGAVERVGASVSLTWDSVPGKSYVVQWAASLDGVWSSLDAVTATEARTRQEVGVSQEVGVNFAGRQGYYRIAIGR